jgi:hypothetical protein
MNAENLSWEFEEPDYEDEPSCPHCGYQMDWADCHMIDCEDGVYDLGEEDCINYDRGTYATCQECKGQGGWWYCPNKDCKPSPSTSSGSQNGQ